MNIYNMRSKIASLNAFVDAIDGALGVTGPLGAKFGATGALGAKFGATGVLGATVGASVPELLKISTILEYDTVENEPPSTPPAISPRGPNEVPAKL